MRGPSLTVPSTELPPHYKPWRCPPGTQTGTIIGVMRVWCSVAEAQASVDCELRRRELRDERDAALGLVFVDGRWRIG